MRAYMIDVEILRHGGNIYSEFIYYNYSPVWAYLLLFLSYLSEWLKLSFPFVVRFSLSIVDIANAILIYLISENIRPGTGRLSFAAYMLNPGAALIVTLHGQFDTLAMLPILLAMHLRNRHPSTLLTWVLGTLSILFKQITLFFVLTLYVFTAKNWRRSIIMILASGIIFLLSFVPFWNDRIIDQVFGYQGGLGIFGLTVVLPPALVKALFLLIMSFAPYLSRYQLKHTLPVGMLTSVLFFFVFIPGFFAHYIILLLIVGAILVDYWYLALSLVSLDLIWLYIYGTSFTLPVRLMVWPLIVARLVGSLIQPKPGLKASVNQAHFP